MANPNAPFGLSQYKGTGSLPTYEQQERAIASNNTGQIFCNDPVSQAASVTGIGSGFLTQYYGPITLTVGATGLATSATGVLTVTFTAPASGVPTSPNAWAPPVGSVIVVVGAAPSTLNGVYYVQSSTTTTAVCQAISSAPVSTTSTASGTVVSVVPVEGVFIGCKYLSLSQKKTVWSNFWSGGDANPAASVTAYVINDPLAQFVVQSANSNTTATAIPYSAIGNNIGIVLGSGNTLTGISTAYADQYTLTGPALNYQQYLPFVIQALANYTPDGSNPLQSIGGNDFTSAYNRVIVAFNNSAWRTNSGI